MFNVWFRYTLCIFHLQQCSITLKSNVEDKWTQLSKCKTKNMKYSADILLKDEWSCWCACIIACFCVWLFFISFYFVLFYFFEWRSQWQCWIVFNLILYSLEQETARSIMGGRQDQDDPRPLVWMSQKFSVSPATYSPFPRLFCTASLMSCSCLIYILWSSSWLLNVP